MSGGKLAILQPPRIAAASRHLGLIAACALALGIGSRGITDEGYVSLHGDMPRLLMNGAFLFDLTRDQPFNSLETLLEYSRQYYARYPALSLGHHAPLIAMAEVPAYALFGVSVASARLVVLLSFLAATSTLYLLVEKLHGRAISLFATALFVTSPHIVILAHSVLSEMLALALVLGSAYYLYRFCEYERRRDLIGFVVTAALSLYAKQVAIFVFPVFLFAAVARLGLRRLFRRDVIVAAVSLAVLSVPIVTITLLLSKTNVEATLYVLKGPIRTTLDLGWEALTQQFAMPAIFLIAAALVRTLVLAVQGQDRTALLWVVWGSVVLAGMVVLAPFEPARYSIYGVPALCALAATAVAGWMRRRSLVPVVIGLMVFFVAAQARAAFARPPVLSAGGYEAAARTVLSSSPGPTVLFSGDIDTGFFSFFVRKHDSERRIVVLRADKILTTSFMGNPSIEDRIAQPEEIYPILKRFGTRFVVIEDRPSSSHVLEWLRQVARSPRFAERARIPIGTLDPRLRGTDLVIYEFLDATAPDPEAVLSINLPVIAQSVSVRLSDLTNRQYRR